MAALDFPASPTLNQIYTANGFTWQWDGTSWNAQNDSPSVVLGPDTATDNAIARFDGTSGKLVQDSAVYVDDSGNVGIGTNSPNAPLVVTSNTNSTGIVVRGRTSDNISAILFDNNTGTAGSQTNYIQSTPNGAFNIATNNTVRLGISSTGYATGSVNGNSAGLIQASQYFRLNSGLAGANATGAQSLFGVGVTLVGSTVYEFEIVAILTKSAGTTSHQMSVGFGGTATLNNIVYEIASNYVNLSGALGGTPYLSWNSSATAMAVSAADANASTSKYFVIKGTVSVNAGGTFIPQYSLSAAPGGAYTTQAGSYIKISPLSASGANTSIGSWA